MKISWNVPNILTMIRMACTPAVIVLFLLNIPNGVGVFVALGIYILACFTDFLDGYIARKYNLITDFGKFMDQIADKAITTILPTRIPSTPAVRSRPVPPTQPPLLPSDSKIPLAGMRSVSPAVPDSKSSS